MNAWIDIVGNYELNLTAEDINPSQEIRVFFSGNEETPRRTSLVVSKGGFKIVCQTSRGERVWKERRCALQLPWRIRILKKGNFFRLWVNDRTEWIRGALGEWEGFYDPFENRVGVEIPKGAVISSFTVTPLPWLQQVTEPVIKRGPEGSFYEMQVIPGAIIKYNGLYYMYCVTAMKGDQEGASRRSIGVAISEDLRNWGMHPEPVIRPSDLPPCDNLYVNGAVVAPEGKVAIMFSAQRFPEWLGFMLATAEEPLGPFKLHPKNPVFKHPYPAHEFDLIRVDHPEYRYMLFYAGFTPDPPTGPPGDRGYLIYSDDLVNWWEDPRNPVFGPETLDNWDAVHVRPRSLCRIGETWYLWYEGCNRWSPPGSEHHGWWDTVGLARSKDLVNWEYYPRNPALPALGISGEQFDSSWVGWPRMLIKGDTCYVFYTGNGQVGLRTIKVEQLTNWESEGGTTIDLLR